MSRRSKRSRSSKYRSDFEQDVANALTKEFKYETEQVHYLVPRVYTPDFVHPAGFYLECKGFFRPGDTQKYKAIRDCLPAFHELIFVLMKPDQRVRKGTKMTMSQWCEKEGLKWYSLDNLQELIDYVHS